MTRRTKRLLVNAAIFIGLLLLATVDYVKAWLDVHVDRLDIRLNPINGYILQSSVGRVWGTRISLMPKLFQSATSRTEIERQLAEAGFVEITDDFARAVFRAELHEGRSVYAREANNLVCNIQLYVVTGFDETGRLFVAEGTEYENGCF